MGPKIGAGKPPSSSDFFTNTFLERAPEQEDRPPSPVKSLKRPPLVADLIEVSRIGTSCPSVVEEEKKDSN